MNRKGINHGITTADRSTYHRTRSPNAYAFGLWTVQNRNTQLTAMAGALSGPEFTMPMTFSERHPYLTIGIVSSILILIAVAIAYSFFWPQSCSSIHGW